MYVSSLSLKIPVPCGKGDQEAPPSADMWAQS